jgi:hypothetical protein
MNGSMFMTCTIIINAIWDKIKGNNDNFLKKFLKSMNC